jgi:isopentenyl-diphosphate delta-isomerase
LQEWFQIEGDKLQYPPIETIKKFIDKTDIPLIVKEVGQGFGPGSISALLKLPLAAIEFGAFGGTNFSKLELIRNSSQFKEIYEPFTKVGADASQMLDAVNSIVNSEKITGCNQIIISGGINSFLDGYYLLQKSLLPAIYGQASSMLKFAEEDYSHLQSYVSHQIKGLELAYAYLRIKP